MNKVLLVAVFGVLLSCVAAQRTSVSFFERQEGDYLIYNQTVYTVNSDYPYYHDAIHQWAGEDEIFTFIDIDVPEDVSVFFFF